MLCLFVMFVMFVTLLYPFPHQVSTSFGVYNEITVLPKHYVLLFRYAMVKNIPKPEIGLAWNLKWHGFCFGTPIALFDSGKYLTIAQLPSSTCQAPTWPPRPCFNSRSRSRAAQLNPPRHKLFYAFAREILSCPLA